jgi:hypothetical protein
MPPASSHLADSPVPAPPPTIGSPRAIMPRKRSSSLLRAKRGIQGLSNPPLPLAGEGRGEGGPWCDRTGRHLAEGADQRGGEGGVVDVVRQADQLAAGGLAHRGLERAEQRRVGGRIVKGCRRGVEQRDAALGDEEAHRSLHAVQPLADPAAHRSFSSAVVRISVTCGLWRVEVAAAIALRHRVARRRN